MAIERPAAFPIVVNFLCCRPLDSRCGKPCEQPALLANRQAAFKFSKLELGSAASDPAIFEAWTKKKFRSTEIADE